MDIINTLKDIVTIVQKSNDIEVIQKIITVQKEILDMQAEQLRLREENKELKTMRNMESQIIRHKGETYITLKDDLNNIFYCSRCWDKEQRLVQLRESGVNYFCPDINCKNARYLT